MIQKTILENKLKNKELTTSTILKDKPQLTSAIDEIIHAIRNGHFTQIPKISIADYSWNDESDLRNMKHKTNEETTKTLRTKSLSEIDKTAKINQDRLIENLEIIQVMMANYYQAIEQGITNENFQIEKARKTETQRIQELGKAEIRKFENKMKKLSKRDLIDKTNKIQKLASIQLNYEYQLIKNAKGMDQEYAETELARIDKLMKKVVVRTFTKTPNEVGRFGSSQEFIPRHYTMPELIEIIQNSEKNTIQTENMFGSIIAIPTETVTFCKLKKDTNTGKLRQFAHFELGFQHEPYSKVLDFGELNVSKIELDKIHADTSLMELAQ
jgi:hypothetical protein